MSNFCIKPLTTAVTSALWPIPCTHSIPISLCIIRRVTVLKRPLAQRNRVTLHRDFRYTRRKTPWRDGRKNVNKARARERDKRSASLQIRRKAHSRGLGDKEESRSVLWRHAGTVNEGNKKSAAGESKNEAFVFFCRSSVRYIISRFVLLDRESIRGNKNVLVS